jgi:hypothetical protein
MPEARTHFGAPVLRAISLRGSHLRNWKAVMPPEGKNAGQRQPMSLDIPSGQSLAPHPNRPVM